MQRRTIVYASLLFVGILIGIALSPPVARAVSAFAIAACNANSACAGGTNSGAGPGVVGASIGGEGVTGQTWFAGTSETSRSGVLGADLSKSGNTDSGVRGNSVRGYGVEGVSANNIALYGISTRGTALLAVSSQGNGAIAQTSFQSNASISKSAVVGNDLSTVGAYNQGVLGTTTHGTGAYGYAINDGNGVIGLSNGGYGIVAESAAFPGSGSPYASPIAALDLEVPNGALALFFSNSDATAVLDIDASANIRTTGLIETDGSCSAGCARHRRVRSYGTASAEPTLEDAGESQLRGGIAYVRLDPAFANAIDPHKGYFVLLTPEGESRGLYEIGRTQAGFTVRENMGGRSSVGFAYRIVARPYGVHGERLATIELPAKTPASRFANHHV